MHSEFCCQSEDQPMKINSTALCSCPPTSLQEYVFRVDPLTSLGLSSDSIVCYRMGEVVRSHASEVPELLPCGYLVGDNNVIKINLKGKTRRKRRQSIWGLETRLGSSGKVFLCFIIFSSFPPSCLPHPRCEGKQHWQLGVRHADSKAHYPAVPQPVDGAPPHHPLRTQRHWQILPGCQAGWVHHFPDGAGGDRAQCGQLQCGPEFQQGKIQDSGLGLSVSFDSDSSSERLLPPSVFIQILML